MKNYIVIGITALSSSLLTVALGSIIVILYVVMPFQKAAVDKGFATWEVTNNATGSTKFTWNEAVAGLHRPNPDTQDLFSQNEKPLDEKK